MYKGGTALIVLGTIMFLAAVAAPPRISMDLFLKERLTDALKEQGYVVAWDRVLVNALPRYLFAASDQTLSKESIRSGLQRGTVVHFVEVVSGEKQGHETLVLFEQPHYLPPGYAASLLPFHDHKERGFFVFYWGRAWAYLDRAAAEQFFLPPQRGPGMNAFSRAEKYILQIVGVCGLGGILFGGFLLVAPQIRTRRKNAVAEPPLLPLDTPLLEADRDPVSKPLPEKRNWGRQRLRRRKKPGGVVGAVRPRVYAILKAEPVPNETAFETKPHADRVINLEELLPIASFLPPRVNADAARAVLYWGFRLYADHPHIGDHFLTIESIWKNISGKVGSRHTRKMLEECLGWFLANRVILRADKRGDHSINPSHRRVPPPGNEIIKIIIRARAALKASRRSQS